MHYSDRLNRVIGGWAVYTWGEDLLACEDGDGGIRVDTHFCLWMELLMLVPCPAISFLEFF
jgi:hypothetical protein